MALTSEQLEALERLLNRDRARLVRRLRRFGENLADVQTGSFSQHMAEQAAALTERENAFLMASEEGRRLVEVDRALDRIVHRPESFGVCRRCGDEIAFERLEAIPYADLCIVCKRVEESAPDGRRD